MKKIYTLAAVLIIIITFIPYPAYPQNITLTGKVMDMANNPLPGANVFFVEGNLTGQTDQQGAFTFQIATPGTYRFIISLVGYATQQLSWQVQPDQADFTIRLVEKINELQGVEIIGRKEQTYKNTQSFAGTKTETPIKYVPQSISYVTKEVMEDQQAFKMNEVIKNISGVNQYSIYNNDLSLRGFRARNALINGLRTPTSSWSSSLLPNIERVEVIKGPASALFANSDPGGTVNTVTKKPLDEARKALGFATGSFNTYRLTADFTGPMNESKSLLYRLNLAYQNAESFRMLQGGEDFVLAPSVSFIPDEKTQVNFDFVYSRSNSRLDRGQPIFGATAGTDLNSTPISFALGKENDYLDELNLYVTTSLQRNITDKISFNASYMKFLYDEDLLEHRTSNRYAVDADGVQIPTLMEMQTIRRLNRNYNDNITLYFVSDVATGPLEHKVLIGYDYNQNLAPVGNSTYNASGYLNASGTGTFATYNIANRDNYLIINNRPVPNVPHFDLANPDYAISDISQYLNVSRSLPATRYYVNGVYLQDQIKVGKVQALLGLRQEYYTDILNYQQSNSQRVVQKALIPRVGLVYTPVEPLSLYGTYTQGYQPQTAGTIGDPERFGGPFDPLISNMVEGGAKMELLAKRLAVNLAAYRIEQNNILVNAGEAGNPDKLRQIGQQQAQGMELDVYGQVLANLSLTANFAYNITEITKSNLETEIGRLLPNAPKVQGGFWAKYSFVSPALKGISVSAGANYVSQRNTLSTLLTLPGYSVYDAAISYQVDKFKFSANLNNIFNQKHWVGGYDFNRLFPGAPRNFLVGIGYSF